MVMPRLPSWIHPALTEVPMIPQRWSSSGIWPRRWGPGAGSPRPGCSPPGGTERWSLGGWWVTTWLVVSNMTFIFHNMWVNHDNPSHLFFRGVETTNQLQLTHQYWALNWSKVKIPSIEHDRNEDHRWTCRWWPPRGVRPHCDCEASIRWVSSVFWVFTFVQDLKLSYKKPPKKQ